MSDQIELAALQAEMRRLREEVESLRRDNKQLLVYKQQLDAILNNAPVEIYLKDVEGRYLRINKEFERIFGVKNADVVGMLPSDIHDEELAKSTRNHDLFVLGSGLVERREEQAVLVSDQQTHILLTIKFPVFTDAGEINGLGAIVTDITERRQAEDTIRRVQKMDAMGELTGGIAHDFNNILGIVMGNLELVKLMMLPDDKLLTHIDAAYKGASRGAEMTRKLLRLSQSSQEKASPILLDGFLQEMEAMTSKILPASIDQTWIQEDNLWMVSTDLGDLEDAIVNLSLNARDAMPDGGELRFSIKNLVVNAKNSNGNTGVPLGEYVVLSVSDNGQGMTSDVLKRAVEPFFTTKSTSKGTGLGLSVVYGFVSRSEGHVNIVSEPDIGTDVSMYFPREVSVPKIEAVENEQPELPRGHETILVVDDEPSLVDIAVSYLQGLGYKTKSANNSEQAMHILRTDAGVDLMFSDVIMPGNMNGYKLASGARREYPSLKLLITSGFTHRYDELNIDESDPCSALMDNVLAKPYNKLSIAIAIRNALDSPIVK